MPPAATEIQDEKGRQQTTAWFKQRKNVLVFVDIYGGVAVSAHVCQQIKAVVLHVRKRAVVNKN